MVYLTFNKIEELKPVSIRCAPYFMMDGNAKEAIQIYKNVLKATLITI